MKPDSKKILIVDDDQDIRSALRKILESSGYFVAEAASGKEGFEKADSELPDLIIIDVIMETFSEGFNLIQRLVTNERTKNIPRILLTALGIQQDLDMIFPAEIGTMSILQKPVEKDVLLKVVSSAFASACK